MNFGHFEILDNKLWIVDIQPHAAIRLKALFQSIATSSRPPFSIQLKPDVAEDFEWFLMRYGMRCEPDSLKALKSMADQSRSTNLQIEQIFSNAVPLKMELQGITLREYQARFVQAFIMKRRMLNGDDVGLGKTIEAIGVLSHPETRPALIVVQAHLVKQWTREVEKILGVTCREIKTTNPQKEVLKPAEVYVTTYHRLAGWVDVLTTGAIKTVVFDEVQELRKDGSEKYRAASHISKAATYALGLSATPVYNYGIEIFNILDCLSPNCLGNSWDFTREWCQGDLKGRVKEPRALGSYLRSQHLMMRRTRADKDVNRELPPVIKIVEEIPFDSNKFAQIEKLAMVLANRTLSGSFVDRGQAARELDIMLRQATGVAKARFVAEYVKILLENDEPVLLLGWHREVYQIWMRELKDYKPILYTGSESSSQKDKAAADFIKGESNLLIMSLRSGVGLDGIQKRCATAVFGELDWSPQVHEQILGRLNRDGQEKSVTEIYLIADGGSDPTMVDLLGLKSEQHQGIVNPNELRMGVKISDDGRIKELARRFLHSRKAGHGKN